MTTYTFPAIRITYTESFGFAATAPSQVRLVVPDDVTGFTYQILALSEGRVPAVTIQTELYSLLNETGPIPFTSRGFFQLGVLESDVEGVVSSSITMTIIPDSTAVFPFPSDFFVPLSGDPVPDGSSLDEFTAWTSAITSAGAVQEGPFMPDTFIPFDSIDGVTSTENDLVLGTASDDSYATGEGNDTLIGGSGDDTLDGGNGTDTVALPAPQSSHTLAISAGGMTITDRNEGGAGQDTLINIDRLDFGTATPQTASDPFVLEAFVGGAGLASADYAQIVELYIAYFNRAPDAIGLNFWATQSANGLDLAQMANLFFDQSETRSIYASAFGSDGQLEDVTSFVTQVYNNVLGRVPDQAGFDFWVNTLQTAPDITPANFILAVLEGAKFTTNPTPEHAIDQAYLNNKTDLGAYFGVSLGMSGLQNASDAMALFDGSEASFASAVSAIDGFHAQALDPENGEFLMPLVGVLDTELF
ncbi:MAG: DUF4214 domain-containing protein [Sulfitobacter sp.]